MKNIEEILKQDNINDIIKSLIYKVIKVPSWDELKKEYDPTLHEIIINKQKYKDKEILDKDDNIVRFEERTRICIGLQKLAANRIAQFMFTVPVNHVLENSEKNEILEKQYESVKKIFKVAKYDPINIERSKIISSQCEQATYWFVTDNKEKHKRYGFETSLKLKCVVFSPEKGDTLFPLFDETRNLIAFSREFSILDKENKKVVYFETWTNDFYYRWRKGDSDTEWTIDDGFPKKNEIGKIPIVYSYRSQPIWRDGDNGKVEQIEKLLSDNGEIISYHSSPILLIKGNLQGAPTKGESNKVFLCNEGAGAEYVSWQQSPESIKFQFESLLRMYWTELQLLDMSYENIRGIGNVAASSMELLFSDAHLKCGMESAIYEEMFEREYSIIKSYLGLMNTQWSSTINDLELSPKITFFMINDKKQKVDILLAANGGQPIISQEKSVELSNLVENSKNEYAVIKAEYLDRKKNDTQDIFE